MHFGIIAAGEGSRLALEGVKVSKPMLTLGGEPMIGRLIRIFMESGAATVNVVINDFMPDVREYLEDMKLDMKIPLDIRVKSTPSSMHTFYELASMLPDRGRFIATTVDTVFREEDFRKYVRAFRDAPAGVDGMMAVTDFIEDEKPLYVGVGKDMEVTGFYDTPVDACRYVSGGIYGLDGKALDVLRLCMERGVERMRNYQRELLKAGLCLRAFPLGKIVDVDRSQDIARAEEFLKGETN